MPKILEKSILSGTPAEKPAIPGICNSGNNPVHRDIPGFSHTFVRKNTRYMKRIIPAEEGDFYLSEEGYRVFTAEYHLKRGYCCESGCRHCPYGYDMRTN